MSARAVLLSDSEAGRARNKCGRNAPESQNELHKTLTQCSNLRVLISSPASSSPVQVIRSAEI